MIDRRDVIRASLAVCAGAGVDVGTSGAAPQDDSTRNWLRLTADLSGRTTWAVTRGDVWGFLPQADDLTVETFARRLYGYWSLVARKRLKSPAGAVVVRLKAWTFYLDAETGAIVTEIVNPYTGHTVLCPALSGPPSEARYGDGGGSAALRERRQGPRAWLELDRVSRFKPADASWFKLEADLTSYACLSRDLDDPTLSHVPNTWSHNLVAEWQTWMGMHGAPGHILFKGDGGFIESPGAAPSLRAAVEARFPGTLQDTLAWRGS